MASGVGFSHFWRTLMKKILLLLGASPLGTCFCTNQRGGVRRYLSAGCLRPDRYWQLPTASRRLSGAGRHPPVARSGLSSGPLSLYVPPGHQKNWGKYCGRYNACGQPVYFVQKNGCESSTKSVVAIRTMVSVATAKAMAKATARATNDETGNEVHSLNLVQSPQSGGSLICAQIVQLKKAHISDWAIASRTACPVLRD